MNFLFESLKYIDCFGVTFNFYTEKSRKLYTAFGGLFTILSIIGGILYFICVEYDDFSHKEPISTISESKVNNTKIKFLEEKIWIPWRIRDYNSKTINFTNLFYPIPFYSNFYLIHIQQHWPIQFHLYFLFFLIYYRLFFLHFL